MNSQLFFASFCLLFATPFLVIGGLAFPYQTTRIITFSVAMIGLLAATLWRMKYNSNFRQKISDAVAQPLVQIYGIFIAWLFVRSMPVFLSESWWGTWFRFDGFLFEASFLCAIVAITAWAADFEFNEIQKKLVYVLSLVLLVSLVIFPILSLDRYVGLLAGGRFNGSVGNPLFLAGLLLFVPWFAGRLKHKNFTIGATIVASGFLIATGTRGAFLAAGAGLLVYIWEYKKIPKRVRIAVVAMAFFVGCVGVWAIAAGKIPVERSVTIATRVAMWKSGATELLRQPLLGFGAGEHRNNVDRSSAELSQVSYGEISDSTHSAYLDLALKGGLIALALFIVWLVVVYRGISGEDRPLGRATLIAYAILIATAPWMSWTAVPLILLVASHNAQKKKQSRGEWIFVGVSMVVIMSSMCVFIVTIKNTTYLARVSSAMNNRQYVNLPEGRLITNKFMPFTKDEMVELLRLTMPIETATIAPSFGTFIAENVVPIFDEVSARELHPDAYNVAATWASVYAASGLTGARDAWFERSLHMQERAININPNRPAAIFQSADTLRELGRITDAVARLQAFAVEHPNLPEARIYYGMMVDLSGDVRGAYEIMLQAKKDFPNYGWKESYQVWFANLEARVQKLPSK